MSEKFTPGPWFIRPDGPRYTVNQEGTNRHVAMVSCYNAEEGDDVENLGNANLIKIAPLMYEALECIARGYIKKPICPHMDGSIEYSNHLMTRAMMMSLAASALRGEK